MCIFLTWRESDSINCLIDFVMISEEKQRDHQEVKHEEEEL